MARQAANGASLILANAQAQKYKVIVAVAVLKSKPANLTVSEYIEMLRDGIKKESIRNSDGCDTSEINNDLMNTQEHTDLTEAMRPSALDECIDIADRTSHREGAESPSILERFTQQIDLSPPSRAQNDCEGGAEKMTINVDAISSEGADDNVDLDRTFCPDILDYDETQIYTVPDDLEVIPYDDSQIHTILNRFIDANTNRHDDENVKGCGTTDLEESLGARHSRVETEMGSYVESEIKTSIRKGSENQKTTYEIGLFQNSTRVDSQRTVCDTQLSQDSTKAHSQETVCESQMSQNNIGVCTQNSLCKIQINKDNSGEDIQKTVCEPHLFQRSTGAIKKKCEFNDNTKNVVKSTCSQQTPTSQKFSDSIIENSQNTNAKMMTDRREKRRNLKRPLDRTNKFSSKVKFRPSENEVIAVSKENLDKNTDKVQNESNTERVIPKSNENAGRMKVDIIENIVIRKAMTATPAEMVSCKIDAKASSSELENDWNRQAVSTPIEDGNMKEQPNVVTSQKEDCKCASENAENVERGEEERLEDYSRIIKDAERDGTSDRPMCAGFPSMDVYPVRGNENHSNTNTEVQNIGRDEDFSSVAGRELEASDRGDRRLTLTIFEVMHKARCYIDREKSKTLNSFSGDSGYGSEWRIGSDAADTTVDHTGTALYKYLLESSVDVDEHTTCDSVSEVLGELVDRLNDEDNRPRFLVEMLDKTTALLGEIFDGTLNRDEVNIQNIDLFRKSTSLHPPEGPTAATYLFLLHSPHLPSNHAALYIPVPASVAPDPAHVCAALASPPRRSHFQVSSATPPYVSAGIRTPLGMAQRARRDTPPLSSARFYKIRRLMGDNKVRKEENVCIFLFLNTSLTILTHSLDKMVERFERLHENLFDDTNTYEIGNLEELENQCYLFHILEILLKRYLKAKANKRNVETNLPNSSSSTRSSIIEVWKSKWCPDNTGRGTSARPRERTCCIWKYREILGKIIHSGVRSYSLVSFAALQCYNLLHS
ncbi:hypothetical protein EVAR_49004_1 [Eumeta japonica]|uniref:Uncharacterized protein n=1 Tax=Eumeta variegata TaxID=151549 RepID=A0A4C1Z172_EUMVA|nr:hypothetical protein EVAR_49004_1 [Eumeta japonica]